MNFLKYAKEKVKYLVGLASIAAILSQVILPLASTKADGPRFNFMAGDYELIRGSNASRNESVWKNPVDASAGERVNAIVYYHNGMLDTYATNTRVKINVPSQSTNKTAIVTASVSADNAETINSTIVDGQIVGSNGLVINFDQDVDLSYIPGSARWFPDSNQHGGSDQTAVAFPSGQSGDEIVSGSGVNIGSIRGCWDWAGFLTVGLLAKQKDAPALDIEKTVRNVSQGENQFVKETLAEIGDEVEFAVTVKNTGNVALSNAILSDTMPAGLNYVSGSFGKTVAGNGSALTDANAASMFAGNYNIGTIAIGDANAQTFKFKTTAGSALNPGRVTNVAKITSSGLSDESTASVVICTAEIVKYKSAHNDSQNVDATVVLAKAGDQITYTLVTKNTGSAGINYKVEDGISDVLEYADVTYISDNGSVVDGTSGNDARLVSWPEINISAGQTINRTFKVKVKNPLPTTATNGYHFDWKMYNKYGTEVEIIIEKPIYCPELSLTKMVRDLTTGEQLFTKANVAYKGDTLEYIVQYSNSGEGNSDSATIYDVIPVNTAYVAGSTVISRGGGSETALADGLTGSGVNIGTIEAGETGYIKFHVTVSNNIAAAEVLTNTAYLNAGGKTLSDTAKTTVVEKTKAASTGSLPKTGAGAGSFLATFMFGLAGLYGKYRKNMASTEVQVIKELIG